MTQVTIPYSLLERGWPYRKQEGMEWTGGSGAKTIGDGRYGLPIPRDRAVLLELATEARDQGPVIRRKPRDIAERYGLSWTRSQVIDAVYRVGYSWYEPPTRDTCCRGGCQPLAHRVAVASNVALCDTTGELVVSLAEPFYREALEGAPGDVRVVRELLFRDQLGALDMYLVTAWKDFRGERGPVPVLVDGCIFGMLSSAKDPSRARQQVWKRWIALSQVNPEMIFEIIDGKKGGPFLVYRADAENQNDLERRTEQAGFAEKSGGNTPEVRAPPRAAGATVGDEQLRALRKHKGALTELPWQMRRRRTAAPECGPVEPSEPAAGDGSRRK